MGAIPSGRNLAALQKTFDDVWVRDDKEFYFGTDGDVAFRYDSSNGVLDIEGADLRISDTVQLQFGEQSAVYIAAGVDASAVSDSIKIVGLPTSDTGLAGALFLGADGSDLCVSTG